MQACLIKWICSTVCILTKSAKGGHACKHTKEFTQTLDRQNILTFLTSWCFYLLWWDLFFLCSVLVKKGGYKNTCNSSKFHFFKWKQLIISVAGANLGSNLLTDKRLICFHLNFPPHFSFTFCCQRMTYSASNYWLS